jgi:hypothetical protein
MTMAWEKVERRASWWRRLGSPPRLAWAGATAVVLLAALAVYSASQTGGGQLTIASPQQDKPAIALQQPILVSFNQPMDHQSTEAAVQITPATTVSFRWDGDTMLYVQPASGNLAPNTQYQVTIGPSARSQGGRELGAQQSITFVTQPVPTPTPSPLPTPSGSSLLAGSHQVATGVTSGPSWSADSATVYFVGDGGALEAVTAAGGDVRTLVADGVSMFTVAPAGDRIAYVRGGSIEILTLATATTTEQAVSPAPAAVTWVRDRLYWGDNAGVFTLGANGPVEVVANPDPSGWIVSIAPDGAHVLFQDAHTLVLVNVATGSDVHLGQIGDPVFWAWSPDGSRVIHGSEGVISDMSGARLGSIPARTGDDVSWSAPNEILIGNDTSLSEVRPDGSGSTKLAVDGPYRSPVFAPDTTTLAFVRNGTLWSATTQPVPQQPSAVGLASAVVTVFMQARLDRDADRARSYLDDAGKAAYAGGNPALIPRDDLGFRRFYILTAEQDPSALNTVRVVVSLVFGRGQLERNAVDETLTLLRVQSTDPFLIDGVTVGSQRDLRPGPRWFR